VTFADIIRSECGNVEYLNKNGKRVREQLKTVSDTTSTVLNRNVDEMSTYRTLCLPNFALEAVFICFRLFVNMCVILYCTCLSAAL